MGHSFIYSFLCPIIVITFAYKFHILNLTNIMGQKWYVCFANDKKGENKPEE